MSDIFDEYQGVVARWNKFKGAYGVEFETECLEPYSRPRMKFWNVVEDGSLRQNGWEYVLKAPLDLNELRTAFAEFDALNHKFIEDSISTSSHLHVNFLNEQKRTLANFLCLYTLLENIIVSISGEDRLSNLFCIPIKDAEEGCRNITGFLEGLAKGSEFYEQLTPGSASCKYGGINLSSFGRFGSIELRTFRGITESREFMPFVTIIDNMMAYARRNVYPNELFGLYLQDKSKFILDVLGQSPLFAGKDLVKLADDNSWYYSEVCLSMKDWKTLDRSVNSQGAPISPKEIDEALDRMGITSDIVSLDQHTQYAVIDNIRLYREHPVTQELGGLVPGRVHDNPWQQRILSDLVTEET